jgi:hypothetical protein
MLIFPMQELLSIAFLMLNFFVFDAEKIRGEGVMPFGLFPSSQGVSKKVFYFHLQP